MDEIVVRYFGDMHFFFVLRANSGTIGMRSIFKNIFLKRWCLLKDQPFYFSQREADIYGIITLCTYSFDVQIPTKRLRIHFFYRGIVNTSKKIITSFFKKCLQNKLWECICVNVSKMYQYENITAATGRLINDVNRMAQLLNQV